MKNTYQTPARKALLTLFESCPHRQFTAEQVCTLLCEMNSEGNSLSGKSTIYRQLNKLCEQNLLRRFEARDDAGGAVNVYQYSAPDSVCESHFHLKCLKCGKVLHLDCIKTSGLVTHIKNTHSFSVDCGKSMLYGICRECEIESKRSETGDREKCTK